MNIGVVGYGYWGSKHARVMCSVPGVSVTIIESDDRRRAAAAAAFPMARTAADLDEALPKLDGIVVATPPGSHASIGMRALEAGVHVMVEKPLARSMRDAETMVELAAQRNLVLMVGHTFEYNPAVLWLKGAFDRGELGDLYYLDSARRNLGLHQRDVNVIWDLAPHDISIANFLLGENPTSVRALGTDYSGTGQIDVAHVSLVYPSGVTAYIHVSWLDPSKVRKLTAVGSAKMVEYDDMRADEPIRLFDKGITVGESRPQDMPLSYRHGDIVSPFVAYQEPLQLEDSHFVECVAGHATCRTPGSSGLEVMRVLEASDVALATGREVRIEPATIGTLVPA
ncbi:MAG: Gfo/Idh/MocA family oxidoreductase [Dehalococcoidia bacterium]